MRRRGSSGLSVRQRLFAKLARLGTSASASRPFAIEAMERRTLLSTVLLDDLNTFTKDAAPSEPLTVGGIAYFFAEDGFSGRELWRTDGTEAGTFMVTEIGLRGGATVDSAVFDGERLVA